MNGIAVWHVPAHTAEPTLPPTALTRCRYPGVVVLTNEGVLLTSTASSVPLPSTTWRSGQTKPSAGHPGLSPLVTCPFTRRKAARVSVLTSHECMFFSGLGNCMHQHAWYVEKRLGPNLIRLRLSRPPPSSNLHLQLAPRLPTEEDRRPRRCPVRA